MVSPASVVFASVGLLVVVTGLIDGETVTGLADGAVVVIVTGFDDGAVVVSTGLRVGLTEGIDVDSTGLTEGFDVTVVTSTGL